MEWFKVISQFIVSLIWPGIVLTLALLFRKEIRGLLSAIKEVKYPGGSITVEVARLEEKVEKSGTTTEQFVSTKLLQESSLLKQADPQLAIAQNRADIEKELFRLSWRTLNEKDIKEWGIARHIDALEKAKILETGFADSLREFVKLSDSIVHGAEATDESKSRLTSVGTSLLAQLHYWRKVYDLVRDFDGHGIWHMHRHLTEDTRKYYFWSAVAAMLPEFEYNYDIYREAAERHNQKEIARHGSEGIPKHAVYILPLDEFIKVLEFRERELLRVIGVWSQPQGNMSEEIRREANYWRWPPEWGDLGWRSPIIGKQFSLYAAEDDLMQTRTALNYYRMRLLSRSERE